MTKDLFAQINQALNDREEWSTRQTQYYRMRHRGIGRRKKPYPGAADLHFPLADSLIEKHKPFYLQNAYATENFASLISLRSQDASLTSGATYWHDYQLKLNSNFETELPTVVDHMLMAGRSVMKVRWDADLKRLCFDSINPLHFIVPQWTQELRDADWCVHVIQMSESQYKTKPGYKQDPAFIKLIKGKGENREAGDSDQKQEKKTREGINSGNSDNQIVLWEVYRRENGRVLVELISPMRPIGEGEVRSKFYLPYQFGPFKSAAYPFVSFCTERKDKGWYSPRGLVEVVASFETSLCKMWNTKHDWMDFFNKPTYQQEKDVGNIANVTVFPGQVIPYGLKASETPAPPISFDQEMQNTRALAEYRMSVPDLGANTHLSGKPGVSGGVTAHQIEAIVQQSSVSDDMKARNFRLDLGALYQMSWALELQYNKASLDYVLNDSIEKLAGEALHDQYLISPNGSADSWNKSFQLQKAIARKQMFTGAPHIDQVELDKTVMEADQPALIKRLFTNPGIKAGQEMEEQAGEIALMLTTGYLAQVDPDDDDKAHIQSMIQFGNYRMKKQEPVTPEQAQLLLMHYQAHEQGLSQKKNKELPQIRKDAALFVSILTQIAQSGQQPDNVLQGPGAPPQSQTVQEPQDVAQTQLDAAKVALDAKKTAASVSKALEGLMKLGVFVTHDQINALFVQMGLPVEQPTQPQFASQ